MKKNNEILPDMVCPDCDTTMIKTPGKRIIPEGGPSY